MYRPAGIYLINLFPLGNWANIVYSMLKIPISRKAHMWFWRCRQWGWRGKGEGREYSIFPCGSSGNKDGSSHAEQGSKTYTWKKSNSGSRGLLAKEQPQTVLKAWDKWHSFSETNQCTVPHRQQVSSAEQEGCVAVITDDMGLCAQQTVLLKPPFFCYQNCCPFLGHARTWLGSLVRDARGGVWPLTELG